MGWIFSIGIFVAFVFSEGDGRVSDNVMIIASAIFAVAGAIGSVANRLWLLKNNSDK